MTAENFLVRTSQAVERFAGADLGSPEVAGEVGEAARYAFFAGGKRLRPGLVLGAALSLAPPESGEAGYFNALERGEAPALRGRSGVEAASRDLLAVATAFEYIHTYSLIHDDLPVMDNDAVRRGRPACHAAFGTPTAVMAGALLILRAFGLTERLGLSERAAIARELTAAAGLEGMVTGQALDILGENRPPDPAELLRIHTHKTAALIRGAMVAGALAVGCSGRELEAVREAGRAAGIAFQVVDDLLDVESTTEQMGKPVGVDSGKGKRTYPAVLGIEASRRRAQELLRESEDALSSIGAQDTILGRLVGFVLKRDR